MNDRPAPRVSIVVPAYQAAGTIAETLEAIQAQTMAGWECLIVDDGSTDKTVEVAARFAETDPRFSIVRQHNQGTAAAYNTGVGRSHAPLIAICSADDVLLPDHLEEMVAFVEAEPGYDIWTSNGYLWRGRRRELFYGWGWPEKAYSVELKQLILLCFYGVGAVYRRTVFDLVGGYRPGVFGEDYDFWLRALARGARHRYLPKALSLWRVSKTQKSASLRKVYESDIRLVSDLRRDYALSPDEVAAVDQSIADRERLIADLDRPRELMRDVLKPGPKRIVIGVLGRDRARRLKRVVQASLARAKPA